jgi:hypothetical protein
MNQGGDRGKAPNKFGTERNKSNEETFQQPKKLDQGRAGQGSANSRTPSPKKTSRRTTSKSRDK